MMSTLHDDFIRHVGQTSPFPNGIEVERAEGCWIYDCAGRRYLDMIAGISVVNVGHCHPRVMEAVRRQAGLYAHTMVYGEHVQAPQVELAREIARVAPEGLDAVYFLTTGAEANDAALKMAVKLTGRRGICAFHNSYHGDTLGALACFGAESYRGPFRSLLPDVTFLSFGSFSDLERIDGTTAAVIVEPVQGEGGIQIPPDGWLAALRARCGETDALLIFDEVQTGFGRAGDWFAARRYHVTPDVITAAKGMGAGYPLAGLIASREMLWRFAAEPPFSHITTFGGNPVSCAAGLASIGVIRDENLLEHANRMGQLLMEKLEQCAGQGPQIRHVRGVGFMIGVELDSAQRARTAVYRCRQMGVLLETTLLNGCVVRFSPPLIITAEQCLEAVDAFARSLT
ncbi:MAG: aspartate aminotransferase family protein [bacterium]